MRADGAEQFARKFFDGLRGRVLVSDREMLIRELADALASLSSPQEPEPVASSIYGPYTPISVGCSTVASPVEPVAAKAEEGWIEATGKNPFQGQPVWEIRHRDGSVKTTREPWNHAWQHFSLVDDIVAYRQRPTRKEEEPRCPKCGAQVDESFDCCKG